MKLFIQLIICLILVVESTIGQQQDVSLIVNLYNNNKYSIGSECGNSTLFTCNNINDALAYFYQIETMVSSSTTNPNSLISQKLNLILDNGIYGGNLNLDFYSLNVSIYPLQSVDFNVVFDGSNSSNLKYPLITISTSDDQSKYSTYLSFYQIDFKNFNNQNLLKVELNSSFTEIEFNNCTFSNYSTSSLVNGNESEIRSMININQIPYGEPINEPVLTTGGTISNVIFEQCIFQSSIGSNNSVGNLISFYNSNIEINNSTLLSTCGNSLFKGDYSVLQVNSTFINGSITNGGVFNMYNSKITIDNSNFQNNQVESSGSIISFSTSTDIDDQKVEYSFFINNSLFMYNSAKLNGGVINIDTFNFNSIQVTRGIIKQSYFNGNSANQLGGIAFINNSPIYFEECNIDNSLGGGSTIYVSNTFLLSFENSFLSTVQSPSSPTPEYNLAFFSSNITMTNTLFNSEFNVYCYDSDVQLTGPSTNYNLIDFIEKKCVISNNETPTTNNNNVILNTIVNFINKYI